ncbi:CAX-interacting protein 4 [Nicotiana tomentosiformis]|uniref:CAX-interacting protein 4 n=1 Tax=Nicotiana tomentosiformis TaxID=4098 RepID=UPI00051AC3D7|nr:CAX-interacting protein 4 [Nicotiana tomentosiformis]XP_018633906.1 CAX-interacting protein 4 [Nicotiana tomentosiformis]XP_033508022.1 CAX-interacting protein 4 [Nicotiana tomentosiformis]XP_033508023.1 CAX-interacting protein 4 [Nicotiana tomentosiformis]
MPATAGRVRMPANNRVHSSAALQTHGIWQSAIGYDPYAPSKEDDKKSTQKASAADPENAYASFQGLLALARITGSNADETRGACKRCGRVGHLTFQCRNFVSVKDDNKDKDPEAIEAAVLSGLEKIKGSKMKGKAENEESSEEEESESSDSDYDSEMERAIAEKYGKKVSRKLKSSRKYKKKDSDDDDESDSGKRKKRGRSKRRSGKKKGQSDSEDDDEDKDHRKRRKEKRRKRDDSSDEDEDHRRMRKSRKEKRRRRSHRHADSSDESSDDSPPRHKRRSRRTASASDSDASNSDDSRVGRDKKRSEKRIRKRHDDEE